MDEAAVGFVGLGNMGWPMASRLVQGGVALSVFDAAAGRAAAFAREVGGTVAPDLLSLAARSAVVVTVLPDGAAVRGVTLGSDGLAAAIGAGALVVDMGSSDPTVYPEMESALAARSAGLIDAPVSGGVKGATDGTLTIMAGGDGAALDRVQPLFELIGGKVFRTGGLGTGQAMKALNNLVSAGALVLTIEALLIGRRSGLEPRLMNQILNVSTGRSNATDNKIEPYVLSRRFDSGFALGLMTKDLKTALAIADATTTPVPLGPHVVEIARRALAALGPDADHTEIARFLETETGGTLGG